MPLKTTLITGATSGIGRATALALAKKGYTLYLLVRNAAKGAELKNEILSETGNRDVFVVSCDLSDLKSVAAAADEIKSKLFNTHLLINNAGGIFDQRELSTDGFEMTFALNHLGHFLLTERLMPLLKKGHARIINVSSEGHKIAKPDFDDLQASKDYSSMRAYGNAKLFNIYFTKALAERYQDRGISAYSLHPGVVKTSFGAHLSGMANFLIKLASPFMITAEQGAKTTIYLATEPRLDQYTGLYFKKKKVAKTSGLANDQSARNKLWEISEKLISGVK